VSDPVEAERIQAHKMALTAQLVPGVEHELNNPLAAILGFSQLIRQDAALPADLRESADLLVEEASRTRRIVQDLFDFLRLRAPERHPTSIRSLIDSVLALQSSSTGRGRVQLDVDIRDDLPTVALDRGQLQLVLLTLTHDAVERIAREGGSRIRVSVTRDVQPGDATTSGGAGDATTTSGTSTERVRLTVTDDAPGTDATDIERRLDASATTSPATDPVGLGLWVSAAIIRAHGGTLRVVPSAFGHGTSFTFDLPVAGVRVEPPAPPYPDEPSLG
jgi:signal transduction histidine kinase